MATRLQRLVTIWHCGQPEPPFLFSHDFPISHIFTSSFFLSYPILSFLRVDLHRVAAWILRMYRSGVLTAALRVSPTVLATERSQLRGLSDRTLTRASFNQGN